MSNNTVKTIINCGTTQVSVAIVSRRENSLFLENFVVEDLFYDYTDRNDWFRVTEEALCKIFPGLKTKGEVVAIAPRQLLLSRIVRIPQVEASKRESVITFEVQSNFPFPPEQMVWGSQVISSDGIEENVAIFASKRADMERFANVLIQKAKVTPSFILPATNLDVHAYYCLTKKEDNAAPVLIVNVGSPTTNLTFVTKDGFDINNIPFGGNYVTQKIQEAFGCSFTEAEKKKLAYFSGELRLPKGDPVGAVFSDAFDSFVRRMNQEITRRLVTFRRTNKAGAPVKIFLSGRGALLSDFIQKLSEAQKVQVEMLDVESLIVLASEGARAWRNSFRGDGCDLQEIVGGAASLLLGSDKEVNLLPPEIAKELNFKKKIPFLALSGLFLAVAPWPVWMHFGEVQTELAKVEKQQTAQIKQLEGYQGELESLDKQTEELRNRVEKETDVLNKRFRWNEFLADGQACLARLQNRKVKDADGEETFASDRHIWIDSLSVVRNLVPAAEDVPAKVVCDAVITFAMLIPEVDADNPEHKRSIFDARRKAILESLAASEFADPSVKIKDVPDFSKPNLPTLTITLRLKSDKGI